MASEKWIGEYIPDNCPGVIYGTPHTFLEGVQKATKMVRIVNVSARPKMSTN